MSTWWTLFTVLLLILPALSQIITTTCEIPSVEAGDDATLTIRFGETLTQKQERDFILKHLDRNHKESEMLTCVFSNGDVKCDQMPCCTWESKVTDVFRVYIHNASQQLEGKFWAFVIPSDTKYQKYCNFTLKASTCPTDHINATNNQLTCNKQYVTIGQSCTVTCNSGHYFQQNQTSVTYTCVGRNKWSPEIPVTSCEASTCPTDHINATNSQLTCNKQSVTIGQSCTVTCNSGHYFQQNQTSVTYTCVGRNKWSPEIPVTSCEVHPKDQNLYFLFLLLSALPIITVVVILFKRRHKEKTKRKNKEDPLLQLSAELQTSTYVQGQGYQQSVENDWLQCVQKWYPHLHSQTYFLPPLHFNRVPYCVENIAGKQVLVPQIPQSASALCRSLGNLTLPPVSGSDLRDDRALQRVLHGMRSLADNGQQKEVMFVVSQLQFDNYLGEPGFAPTAALLPRPSTLPEHFRQQHYDKGHFDVLIIHRHHGLFILEINSVGEDSGLRKMTDEQEDDLLIKNVEKITQQLNKAEVVLRHLTSNLKAKINITKSLVMPNIKSSQLQRAINRYPSAGKDLYQCLGVQSVDDAVKLCLLSDHHTENQLSSEINKSFLEALRLWWQHVAKASGTESLMTSALYEQLLARFCGPATTVEVHSVIAPRLNIRTLGEAVSETGERVARLVLFPQQVDMLNRSPPGAFLSGPPGTGKTILLIMQGLTWLQRGHDVHVVSTYDVSRAATIVIEHQLQETAKTSTAKPRVNRHQFDFWKDGEIRTAVRRLKSLNEGRQLCVIADEVVHDYYRISFTEFCDQLIVQVPGVFIWGASVYHGVRPLCLEEIKLTTPLRSPPVVVREVMESWEIKKKQVHNYTVSDVPVPTDGPPVMRIKHRDGQSSHTGVRPRECIECGHEVARVLTELDVGRTGDSNGPPPLKYRDVLVVCSVYPTDDHVESFGLKTTTASGLVRGLHDCYVPMRVVGKGDEAAILDTALGVGDLVTVANSLDVQGLERKVVVVERRTGDFDFFDRLLDMSRCTSQLVVIDW